jgi:hypothetical protein
MQPRHRRFQADRSAWLDHPDQAVRPDGIIDHGEISGLEYVQRHLSAWKEQGSGKRKYGNNRRKIGRFGIGGVTGLHVANSLARPA